MKKHFQYLRYLLKHKWYVAIECFKRGLCLHALTHDLSKFRPSEWFPYVEYFYGDFGVKNQCPAKWLSKRVLLVQQNFDYAWLLHQKRNKHHWQYWILNEDEGQEKLLLIPDKVIVQMACDWVGASKAIRGKDASPVEWYKKVKDGTKMTGQSRSFFEKLIGVRL